jgi:DNA-binding IclR family transcriptional regulator
LANFGKDGRPERIIAKISQETLAEMIGTTRSRVSHFMNKFRKLGFIDYNGHLEVYSSLLNVVLHDQPQISGVHAAAGSFAAKLRELSTRLCPCDHPRPRPGPLTVCHLTTDQPITMKASIHGENRPQNHDFLALTPITIITITMMAATKRAVPSEN